MSGTDFVFNVALGRVRMYYDQVKSNSPAASTLTVVALQVTGLQADATLRDHDDLAALLAAANDEPTNTNYARKQIADGVLVASAQDDTNDRLDLDIPDQTWTAVAAGTNWAKLLVCYNPDGGTTDSSIIPLTAHSFDITPDGSDIVAQINASGFYRAA